MFSCPLHSWFAPVVGLLAGFAIASVDQPAGADPFYPSVVSRSDREKQIVAELDNEVRGFEFPETALQDFAEAMGEIHGFTVAIDTTALQQDGLDPSIPVNNMMSGVSLRSALRRTLEPLNLTYAIRDEVLLITTPNSPNAFEVRCYNVGELLGGDRSSDELVASLSRILDTPAASHMGAFDEGADPRREGAVAPQRCIATFGDVMIVRDTMCGHEQVGKILGILREVLPSDPRVTRAEVSKDGSSRRPLIRRAIPGNRGSRRPGKSVNEGTEDPFSSGTDRQPTTDPFGGDPFGGTHRGGHSQADDPFEVIKPDKGTRDDDPFGDAEPSKGSDSADPFGQ
jgi:hypothetical protein